MHLILQTIVPFHWNMFSGVYNVQGQDAEAHAMTTAEVAAVGNELSQARATVSRSQARALRGVHIRFHSFKTGDWMVCSLPTSESVFAGQISDDAYLMFMALCKASRLLFRPSWAEDQTHMICAETGAPILTNIFRHFACCSTQLSTEEDRSVSFSTTQPWGDILVL